MTIELKLPVDVQNEAILRFPQEACGLVLAKGKKTVWVTCRNVSSYPTEQFRIDPLDYAAAMQEGEVIGVWHTHVNQPATASVADLQGCEASNLPWYIVSIHESQGRFEFSDIQMVTPSGFEMPYLDRPYVFGIFDCWSLVRDYYKREYSLTLGDYPRIENFWKTHRFFSEGWKQEGFVQLVDIEPVIGDVFLVQTDNVDEPNHILLYIGDDKVLHHSYNRLSSRDVYGGGYWQKHTVLHLRHKELMQC